MAEKIGDEWRNKKSILYFQRLLRLLLELLLSVNDITNIYSMSNNIVIVMYRVSFRNSLQKLKSLFYKYVFIFVR